MMTNPPYIVRRSKNKEEWLKNREGVLTATQIARLIAGTPSDKRAVAKEFRGEHSDFDNRYMRWGREREPVLAEKAKTTDSSLEPNDQFLVFKADERLGATPDLLGERGDIIGEIKTSSHPAPGLEDNMLVADGPSRLVKRYWWQVQTQLLVTGAEVCLFLWEQHDGVWIPDEDGLERPKPGEETRHFIYPDKTAQERIKATVDEFFDDRSSEVPERVTDIISKLRVLDDEKKRIHFVENLLRDELSDYVGVGESLALDGVTVSHYQPKPRKRFDTKAFKSTHGDLYDEFVTEQESKPTLRIQFKED